MTTGQMIRRLVGQADGCSEARLTCPRHCSGVIDSVMHAQLSSEYQGCFGMSASCGGGGLAVSLTCICAAGGGNHAVDARLCLHSNMLRLCSSLMVFWLLKTNGIR